MTHSIPEDPGHRQLEEDELFTGEALVDGLQSQQAAGQEPRSGDDQNRDGHLRDHKCTPDIPRSERGPATSPRLELRCEIDSTQ